MRLAWAILKKELKIYFVSPLAYAFLGASLFLAGLFFTLELARTGEASLRGMLSNLAVTLVFLLPLLTMRHFAEERRQGTFELMMTAPIPLWALLAGKWMASLALCLLLLVGTLIFPLILAYYGDPDWGVIATSYLGVALCCGAFTAAGMLASSLTDEPVAAGVFGVLILMPFWVIGRAAEGTSGWLKVALHHLGLTTHLDPFTRGVIDSAEVLWFVLFTFFFLFLTWRNIESRRWR